LAQAAPTGLAEIVSPSLVFPDLRGETAEQVLAEIAAGLAGRLEQLQAEPLRHGFVERERLGSTAIAGGLAVPHCRVPGLASIRLAVGIHRRGVDFGAADQRPTHLFFALVSPAAAPGAHLQLLASIARWARVPGRVEEVVAALDPAALLAGAEPDERRGAIGA
jgi:PTS system nitrogen regulatory IIA component